jgi:hypothetical protein
MSVTRPESVRQTFLAQMDECSHSGYLALKHEGREVGAHALNRGTLFHMTAEAVTDMAVKTRDTEVLSGDLARDVAQQMILNHPELPIPAREQEAVRLMAWNWGEAAEIDLDSVLFYEDQVNLELGGLLLHGTPDYVEYDRESNSLWITDYKTSLAIPSQEKYEKKFQPQFYALLCTQGVFDDTGERVKEGVFAVHTREVYPRYRLEDGSLAVRSAYFTQENLADFSVAVESIVGRIEHGLETDEWPAVSGEHCSRCAMPSECPLLMNNPNVPLLDREDAASAAQAHQNRKTQNKELWDSLRAWVDEHGPLEFGNGQTLDLKVVESGKRVSTRMVVE